jgi:5-methylcytosine-specific restriction endonuclease McrA
MPTGAPRYPMPFDRKTGRFLRLPPGAKPPKMIEMEGVLGVSFEDDYREHYLSGKMGQKVFARRWKSTKNQIFAAGPSTNRRCWTVLLDLPRRGGGEKPRAVSVRSLSCEICGVSDVHLDRAHWIANADGGSAKRDNILNLCPNCHRKLDVQGDKNTILQARLTLLLREVRTLLATEKDEHELKQQLFAICKSVIQRTT